MAGIYIPGMEMPNKKNGAVLIIYPDGKCSFEEGKTYQAIPVPDHGRLVEADAVVEQIDEWIDVVGYATVGKGLSYYGELLGCIEDAPTIIPADKEGE